MEAPADGAIDLVALWVLTTPGNHSIEPFSRLRANEQAPDQCLDQRIATLTPLYR